MARIHLLPAVLADQIAAGEVVERPASVVKELVENALDAGARRVEVEIERGGLGRIIVADDGEGMSPDDAHLALRRHATSKLHSADDLFRLSTFGFRGEALPSIASISDLTLVTRTAAATAAYSLRVRGGAVLAATEVGGPRGTRVEVRSLFANVPARLKFQKAGGTEATHVIEVLQRAALSAPAVHVRARVDGRVSLDLPPHRSLAERARAIVQRSAGRGTRIVTGELREGDVHVEAHLAPPDYAVQTARRVHLLINRRVVRDRGLLGAVQLGFGDLLARGRHPLAVVSISMPTVDVDVNVHPQKTEVRLARAAEVYTAVRHAVWRVVADAEFVRPAGTYTAAEPAALFAHDEDEQAPYADERERAFEAVRALAGDAHAPTMTAPSEEGEPRFLGALAGGYLVFARARGLLVVDQHAASAFAMGPDAPDRRSLTVPIQVLADADERATLTVHRELLQALGFAYEPTARGAALQTHPRWASDPVDALRDLLAALIEDGPAEAQARAISAAAISPATVLDADAALGLLHRLNARLAATNSALSDARWRGRRVAVPMSLSELTRRFEA